MHDAKKTFAYLLQKHHVVVIDFPVIGSLAGIGRGFGPRRTLRLRGAIFATVVAGVDSESNDDNKDKENERADNRQNDGEL